MSTPQPTQSARVKEIFLEACELSTEQLDAFLDASCGGDATLRAAVNALLDAHDRAGAFLAGPTVDPSSAPPSAAPAQMHRERIGPYKVLHLVGEGGFGAVYLAEQEHPIRRRVALKVIKPGMDSGQVIARFEAERQALAMMDHPNIAKVFDAGTTAQGRPFFVMELAAGVPITDFCDKSSQSVRQRLELFAQVCQAVQHAHQKGIIHRDIKPTNILVSEQDGRPLAKVIDFGIAKATQSRLTERTLFTEFRQMIGTPEYMSPEQAGGSVDVDTRSDIYSLGVLLYELLTGTTPFDARELRSKAYAEIERVIREVDPPRPSTRLHTMRETLPSVAARRQVEPKKLGALVHGELDWIVMKCLEKDRARRYETANGLSADVLRYLSNEPISAGPASAAYRFQKFVRRHKTGVAASAAMVFLLIAGVIGTTIGLIGESRQRRLAEQHRIEAEQQRTDAQANAQEATRQAAIAQAVSDFQTDMLSSADPEKLLGDKVTVMQAVTAAVKELDAGKLKDQPLVEASVRETIGNTLRGLGRYDQAEPNLRRAVELRQQSLAPDDPDIAESLCSLAWLLNDRGQFVQAELLVRQALDVYRRKSDDRNVAATLGGVAVLLEEQGKLAEAEPMYRESLAIRRRVLLAEHPEGNRLQQDIGRNLHNLASVLSEQQKFDEAEPLFREALEIFKKVLPPGHLQIAVDLNNLGMLLEARSRFDEAEPLLRQALEMRRSALPAGHQAIADSLINLSMLLRDQGKLLEAEAMAREGLEMYRKALPPGHPRIGPGATTLAKALHREGRFAAAEPLYREAIAIAQHQFGSNHLQVGLNRLSLGIVLGKLDRPGEAETELLEADRILASSPGASETSRQQCYEALAAVYAQHEQSEPGKGYAEKGREWQKRLAATRPSTAPRS